jgi:hypothetical protein
MKTPQIRRNGCGITTNTMTEYLSPVETNTPQMDHLSRDAPAHRFWIMTGPEAK